MALNEYKFIENTPKTSEEQKEMLKNELTAMEEHHLLLISKEDVSLDEQIATIEAQIIAKRTEYENMGGTYPE